LIIQIINYDSLSGYYNYNFIINNTDHFDDSDFGAAIHFMNQWV